MVSIRLEKVSLTYPGGQVALRDLDLDIGNGELLAVVGPSGCGKTSLLRVIAGLERPTAGRVLLDGRDETLTPPQRRDVALVFQQFALYPHLTVWRNLEFPLRLQRVGRAERDQRVAETARMLGLVELLERRPAQLSGGEMQRVALGRAIIRRPRAFLLDEPLSNLDAQLRAQMRTELARLHRALGITTIHVTHDQEEALTVGHRVAVLREGALQQIALPREVYDRPANTFVAGFIGSPPMNLLPCDLLPSPLGGRGVGGEGDKRLGHPLTPCPSPPGGEGNRTLLGIRPRDIRLTSQDDADAVGIIDLVQFLGGEQVISVNLIDSPQDKAVTVVAAANPILSMGERVGLRFARERLHHFEVATGRRVDGPSP